MRYKSGDIAKIKIIIWDLDETLWKGTVDDGDIPIIPELNVKLLNDSLDRGIINSICSKNDNEVIRKVLEERNIDDLFVFCSIEWSAKSFRIKELLDSMGLRSANALFIDDNLQNLGEVESLIKDIYVASPDQIQSIYDDLIRCNFKIDRDRKRLEQYKLLEKKKKISNRFSSNIDFLKSCNIRVTIKNNCLEYVDRIHELILRSNQLNFTKKRISKSELLTLLNDDNIYSGSVWVTDKFGDYGMVGFFSIKNGTLEHFLFSCRTIGMGIENYVFNFLNKPRLCINGEVIGNLNAYETIDWINNDTYSTKEKDKLGVDKCCALFKGPCDMAQIFNFIKTENLKFEKEFTYNSANGVSIQGAEHITQIVEGYTKKNSDLKFVIDDLPFTDDHFFKSNLFSRFYDYVFLSTLHDSHLGIYKCKKNGVKFVFGEAKYPLTDIKNHDKYIKGEVFTSNCKFNSEFLKRFSDEYEFCGISSAEEFKNNILFILDNISPKTKLVLLLGPEHQCNVDDNPAFEDSHLIFKRNNNIVKEIAKDRDNLLFIEYDQYINGQEGFYQNIYHYTSKVYYEIANEIVKIINNNNNSNITTKNKISLFCASLKQKVKKFFKLN